MDIYLPIAEISVNWAVVLVMGVVVGFLAGMLGVGGGFLMTPLLIFYGIPPNIAVATQASPIAAASLAGALAQKSRHNVDFKMGLLLLAGGTAGSAIGVYIFGLLQTLGQIDLVIDVSYVLLLGSVGGLMLKESVRILRIARRGDVVAMSKRRQRNWIQRLPFKTRFPHSQLYISVIPPVVLGLVVGALTAILGVGGAFLLIPAKIYVLGMRTKIAVGTSQFQVTFVAAMTTLLHACTDHTVDIVLAFLLICGGVIGARLGARIGTRLRGEEVRALLGLLIVGIALRLFIGLVITPAHNYSVVIGV